MIIRYSYLMKQRKKLFADRPYYYVNVVKVGDYECEEEDFKKLFNVLKKDKDILLLTLEKRNGEAWIWKNAVGFGEKAMWKRIGSTTKKIIDLIQ